mgnify:CR=1 FL=1
MGLAKSRYELLERAKELLGDVDVAIEIGVHYGEHAAAMNEALRPTELYLIDAWGLCPGSRDSTESQEYWIKHKKMVEGMTRAHSHMKMIHSLAEDAVSSFDDESADFIYLDATHTYEMVATELRDWWPKVKNGAIIAGDDYCDEYKPNDAIGVVRAVTEFREQHSEEIEVFEVFGEGLISSWLIKMKSR